MRANRLITAHGHAERSEASKNYPLLPGFFLRHQAFAKRQHPRFFATLRMTMCCYGLCALALRFTFYVLPLASLYSLTVSIGGRAVSRTWRTTRDRWSSSKRISFMLR